jgi:hypothetical protein
MPKADSVLSTPIDRMLPAGRFSKPNMEAHANRATAAVGDSESVLYAAQDAETEALDTLIWTPPTTIAGVLALPELLPELRRARVMDDDQANTIIISVIDALDDIHGHKIARGHLGRAGPRCEGER